LLLLFHVLVVPVIVSVPATVFVNTSRHGGTHQISVRSGLISTQLSDTQQEVNPFSQRDSKHSSFRGSKFFQHNL
jgi:hypothetical protein